MEHPFNLLLINHYTPIVYIRHSAVLDILQGVVEIQKNGADRITIVDFLARFRVKNITQRGDNCARTTRTTLVKRGQFGDINRSLLNRKTLIHS